MATKNECFQFRWVEDPETQVHRSLNVLTEQCVCRLGLFEVSRSSTWTWSFWRRCCSAPCWLPTPARALKGCFVCVLLPPAPLACRVNRTATAKRCWIHMLRFWMRCLCLRCDLDSFFCPCRKATRPAVSWVRGDLGRGSGSGSGFHWPCEVKPLSWT